MKHRSSQNLTLQTCFELKMNENILGAGIFEASNSDGPIVPNKLDLSIFDFLIFYLLKQELRLCHNHNNPRHFDTFRSVFLGIGLRVRCGLNTSPMQTPILVRSIHTGYDTRTPQNLSQSLENILYENLQYKPQYKPKTFKSQRYILLGFCPGTNKSFCHGFVFRSN